MTENPWSEIEPPEAAETLNTRRVDAANPWGFFWGRAVDSGVLLVLRHNVEASPRTRLPRVQGIDLSLMSGGGGENVLLYRLIDLAHRDLFYRLCVDIVQSGENAESESEAVGIAVGRTWRWHHLLRGGRDGRLSQEKQKGLIGELLVMEQVLLPVMPSMDAVSSWHGPLGSPKDFECGTICIEAKARRGTAEPFVVISSEHQLDSAGSSAVFLHVVDLAQAPAEDGGGWSLSEAVDRLRDRIASGDQGALVEFESLLAATGYRSSDDYSDSLWTESGTRMYRVEAGFPRICGQDLSSGVSKVQYRINLKDCELYVVGHDEVAVALATGGADE